MAQPEISISSIAMHSSEEAQLIVELRVMMDNGHKRKI